MKVKLAALGVGHNRRPGLIGFTQGDRISVPRTAIPSERLARNLRNVRTAHHDGNAHGSDRIGDSVCLGDHSGHCADADKADSPLLGWRAQFASFLL